VRWGCAAVRAGVPWRAWAQYVIIR
jgi:hypothetical protein